MAKFSLPLAALILLGAAPFDSDEAARKELDKLQGTWDMASLEIDGQQVAAERLRGTTLTIKGDKYVVKVKDAKHEMTMRLDPGKKPKSLDMLLVTPDETKVHAGIYELDGDTLKICRAQAPGKPRPTEFGTWPDTGVFLVVWKRQKP